VINLASGGRQYGPFSLPAVATFVGGKDLPADLHFWREGMVDWQPVEMLGLVPRPAATAQREPSLIIVLGMHRSGTSCLAALLQACGVYLGNPTSFMAAAGPQNPKGFWERREIRQICDTLLHSTGLDWDQIAKFDPALLRPEVLEQQRAAFAELIEELATHAVSALKEPRFCFLLPLLADLIPNAVILHIYRHPASVAASLATRNNFPLPYGLALWEAYNLAALRATQGWPVHRISYEGLVGRPRETTRWLRAILHDQHGIGLSELSDESLAEVVDPALNRSTIPPEEGDRWLNDYQAELLAALRSPSETPGMPVANSLCLETLRAFDRTHATAMKWEATSESLIKYSRVGKRTGHQLSAALVVSLTSHPARFRTLHLTLECLLAQRMSCDKILLWIAHADRDELPRKVRQLEGPRLSIVCCEDWHAYKKIIPTLEMHPDAYITTADDDAFYRSDWLEGLVNMARSNPSTVVAHIVRKIALNPEGIPDSYSKWALVEEDVEPSRLNFPTGAGGVMYPPGAFHQDVLRQDLFQSLAPTNDDIWLYWMWRLNGLQCQYSGATHCVPRIRWPESQSSALWPHNKKMNDTYVAAMVQAYGFPS
jgi:hypothetical protein